MPKDRLPWLTNWFSRLTRRYVISGPFSTQHRADWRVTVVMCTISGCSQVKKDENHNNNNKHWVCHCLYPYKKKKKLDYFPLWVSSNYNNHPERCEKNKKTSICGVIQGPLLQILSIVLPCEMQKIFLNPMWTGKYISSLFFLSSSSSANYVISVTFFGVVSRSKAKMRF